MQHDLLELEDNAVIGLNAEELNSSHKKRLLDPQDRSVVVHVCHSPQREVEVLQDQLLAMMEADPSLTPRDIIVMVADIDAYTPYIQAVFGNAPTDRYLPFAISDRRASFAHPAIMAFINLLGLPESRFACEEVLALLEVPALAARFAIDEEGLRRLRMWVEESGIRWGWMTIMCASWSCRRPASTPALRYYSHAAWLCDGERTWPLGRHPALR